MSTSNLHKQEEPVKQIMEAADPAVNNYLPVLSTQQTPKPAKKLKVVRNSRHKRVTSSLQKDGILKKIRESNGGDSIN